MRLICTFSQVAQNIEYSNPEEGAVYLRMVQLAKERNIDYNPSNAAVQAVHAYCLRKGIPPPEGLGGPDGPVPQYVPQPAPVDFAAMDQPPAGGPPGGMGGMGGPPGGNIYGSADKAGDPPVM